MLDTNRSPLPDMTDAYRQVLEGKKKKEPRWQDDDCDGKWYEKSDTDGKISKREKKAKEKAYSEEVETTEGKKIKEAFAFSNEEFEELAQLGEEIDAMSDEELVDLMIESIHEIAEDDQDLIEICEHLEETEVLTEHHQSILQCLMLLCKHLRRKHLKEMQEQRHVRDYYLRKNLLLVWRDLSLLLRKQEQQ